MQFIKSRPVSLNSSLLSVLCKTCCLVAHSCPTLCDPVDYSWTGSSVHAISQARIMEWVAISFSKGSSQSRDQTCVSCIASVFFTAEPPGEPQYDRQRCNHLKAQLGRIHSETDSRVIGRTPFLTGCWTKAPFSSWVLAGGLSRLLAT